MGFYRLMWALLFIALVVLVAASIHHWIWLSRLSP